MEAKSILKLIVLFTLGIIFSFSLFMIADINLSERNNDRSMVYLDDKNFDSNNPKISAASSPIHIDYNDPTSDWTVAKDAGICTGNGTYPEPYVIKNLVIDGGGSASCILIQNSLVYFKIENCTLSNSRGYNNAGIKIERSKNGNLTNNLCSNNENGISLISGHNNTISGNTVKNNNHFSIYIWCSYKNTIMGNDVSSNRNYGIYVYHSTKNNISGNNANYNYYGIYLDHCDDATVSGNFVISNGFYGIYLDNSDDSIISRNIANRNRKSGITLSYSINSVITGNNLSDCGFRFYGNLEMLSSQNVDTSNLVNGKRLYYYLNETDLSPNNFTNAGQVILVNCNNSLISNVDTSECSGGISLYFCNYNNVSGNTANNNYFGILLKYSNFNTISENSAHSNELYGIWIDHSDYNTISGNTANSNSDTGISFWGCYNNTILKNYLSYNGGCGIFLDYCIYNEVLGNTIKNNTFDGVYLIYCKYNVIKENIIINNDIGITLLFCLYNEISNNTFQGNNRDIKIFNLVDFDEFEYLETLCFLMIMILSIATNFIVITSLIVQLITRHGYPKRREVYHPPFYGISAILVESLGVLIFIINAISLNSRDSIAFNLFFLTPFSLAGIILSSKGLKRDARIFSAKLGIIFGIAVLILGSIFFTLCLITPTRLYTFPPISTGKF